MFRHLMIKRSHEALATVFFGDADLAANQKPMVRQGPPLNMKRIHQVEKIKQFRYGMAMFPGHAKGIGRQPLAIQGYYRRFRPANALKRFRVVFHI